MPSCSTSCPRARSETFFNVVFSFAASYAWASFERLERVARRVARITANALHKTYLCRSPAPGFDLGHAIEGVCKQAARARIQRKRMALNGESRRAHVVLDCARYTLRRTAGLLVLFRRVPVFSRARCRQSTSGAGIASSASIVAPACSKSCKW